MRSLMPSIGLTPRLSIVLSVALSFSLHAAELRMADSGMHVPVMSMREARLQTTLLQQYDFSCGSAAVATLLTHQYGNRVSEQAVFDEMFQLGDQQVIRKQGFSLLDMKHYLAKMGFKADGFEQPLDTLFQAKLPAIVLISENGYNHFVVIKGYRDGRILIGDPASGTRALSRKAFETLWTNRLLFVIHDHTQSARFNELADWQAAPKAPLSAASANALRIDSLPRFSAGEF